MNRKPLPTIGVDKYTFFKVKSDDAEGITYDTAQSLRGIVEIVPTDTGGSDVFDADNGAYYYYIDDDKLTPEKKTEIAEKWFTDMKYTPAAE